MIELKERKADLRQSEGEASLERGVQSSIDTTTSSPDHVGSEVQLLLCCARTVMEHPIEERIHELVRRDLNWEYVTKEGLRQGIVPLLYRHLHSLCPEAVPPTVLDQLRDQYHQNALWNIFLTRELVTLLKEFQRQGIPAFPFKGPALAVTAYRDLTLRMFGDLDLVIRKEDLGVAKELLLSQGYRCHLTKSEEQVYLHHRYHHSFLPPNGKFLVEIHWDFSRRHWSFPVKWNDLWLRAQPLSLLGHTISTFHPEDLLVLLCIHGAKDAWGWLGLICDIAEMSRVPDRVDWTRVFQRASRLRGERVLEVGLLLAQRLLGAPFPNTVRQRLRYQEVVEWLANEFQCRLFSNTHSHLGPFPADAVYLRMRERVRDRIPYLLYHFPRRLHRALRPNARDRAFLPLPAFLSFLYYVLRPIRLAWTYGWCFWKPLFRF